MVQVAFRSTRSLGAICPRSPTRIPPSTACASSRRTRLWPSPASGTSFAVSARSRRPRVRSSPSMWYVPHPQIAQHQPRWTGSSHVGQISEKHPLKVKNFGIWIRYDSRSGTHNMYKEYRETSRAAAVEALYADMAARHRARFRSIHVRTPPPTCRDRPEVTNTKPRSSVSSSSRRPRTSSAPTSSNSSPRTSRSLSPTVFPRSRPPSCSARRARPLMLEGFLHGCGWGWQVLQVFIRKMGYPAFAPIGRA
jgi:ribosomal protein L20A (L18A)